MAIGGETIGRAYVRVLADGSGFGDDLRRQARQHSDEFEAMGKKSSKDFWDGYDKENEKRADVSVRDIQRRIERGVGRMQNAGELLGDGLGDGLLSGVRRQLEKRFGEIGSRMFANLNDELESGKIDFTGMMSKLDDLRPLVARATQDIVNEQQRITRESNRNQLRDLQNTRFAEQEVLKHRIAQYADLGKAIERASSGGGGSRRELLRDLKAMGAALPEVVRNTDSWRARNDELHGTLLRATPAIARMRSGLDGMANTIGRFSGRGSRNDLVNFFGGFMGIGPRVISAFAGIGGAVQSALGGLADRMRIAQKTSDGFLASLLSVAGQGVPGLVGAAISVGAVIEIVVASLGVLGSAVSLTAGMILALAGSLGFALVGGLVAAAGAMVPFAAGLGVVALAVGGLGKKNKAVKELTKDWKDLQKVAAKAVFGKDMAGLSGLSNVMKAFRPLVKTVGEAVGGLLTKFEKATGTKAFADSIERIGKVLGPMVTQIGDIAGNLGVGLGQAFIAAEPLINDFLGWLEDVSKAFVDLGKGGKTSDLAGIFDQARRSGELLWDLVTEVGDSLGLLLSAGAPTGDSILDKLIGKAEELHDWLSAPENQDTINQWFIDAGLLADALGTVADNVIKFVDELDTPTNRATLIQIVDLVGQAIGLLATAAGGVAWLNEKFVELGSDGLANAQEGADSFGTRWDEAIQGVPFDTLKQRAGEAWAGITGTFQSGFFSGLGTTISTAWGGAMTSLSQRSGEAWAGISAAFAPVGAWFQANVGTRISTAWDGAMASLSLRAGEGWAGITAAFSSAGTFASGIVNTIVAWFATLPGRITGALGDIGGRFQIWLAGVPQKIQSAVGLVAGAFSGLAGKAIARAGNIATAFTKWVATLPGKARTIATSAANGFVGLAAKIITKAGSLASRFASWVASLPGKARSIATSAANAFAGLAGKIISKAGSIASRFASWVAGLPGKAKAIANSIANAFSGLANKAMAKAGSIVAAMGKWASGVAGRARGVANDIVDGFRGLAGRIINAIGTIIPKIKMPNIPRPTVQAIVKVVKPGASGFVTNGPEVRLIGEAGPEAVVPLNRALNRVDPAVRALSAFAQGIAQPGGSGTAGPSIGRQIDVGGITINTPTSDPRAVASEVVARMTYAAYI